MTVNELFPSKYVKKEDLPHPVAAPISHVAKEEIQDQGGKKLKPVLYFTHTLKPLILNRGNAATVEALHGSDVGAWAGKVIEVYHDPSVMFGLERVGGVRIRAPQHRPTGYGPPRKDEVGRMRDESEGSGSSLILPTSSFRAGPLWDLSHDGKNVFRQTTAQVIDWLKDMTDRNIPLSTVRVRDAAGVIVTGEVWWTSHAPVATEAPGGFIPF